MSLRALILTISVSASLTSAQLFRRSILPSPPGVQKILPAPCDPGFNLLKTASNLNRAVQLGYPQEVYVSRPLCNAPNRPVLQPYSNQVQVIPSGARPVVPNSVVSPVAVPQYVGAPGNVVSVPAYPQCQAQVPSGNPFLPAASPISALVPPTSSCLPPALSRNNRNNFLRKIPIPPPMC